MMRCCLYQVKDCKDEVRAHAVDEDAAREEVSDDLVGSLAFRLALKHALKKLRCKVQKCKLKLWCH